MIRDRLRRLWRRLTRADRTDEYRRGATAARTDLAVARANLAASRDLVAFVESLLTKPPGRE